MVSSREQLHEIFNWLKDELLRFQDLGLQPPPLSPHIVEYLNARAMQKQSGQCNIQDAQSLEELRALLGECTRCPLHRGRNNLVFGEGNAQASLVFVGEAPGREEDITGRPFVGDAGRLLTRIIEKGMGLKREEVYICNVVKCRPPKNRDPETKEVETCIPFLRRQIQIIGPQVICTLGRVAAQALLGKDFKITRDRGKWHEYEGIAVMPTFHPAYLLRNPKAKRPVWEDIQKIMERLGLGSNHDI